MAQIPETIPVSNLSQNAAALLKRKQVSPQPRVITGWGQVAVIGLSVDAYERGGRARKILQLLMRGGSSLPRVHRARDHGSYAAPPRGISTVGELSVDHQLPQAYEQCLVPVLCAPRAVFLVAQGALQPGERVLDAVCGTGIVARTLPPGLGASMAWHKGNLEALPFDDQTFDVVLCQPRGFDFARTVLRQWASCSVFYGKLPNLAGDRGPTT